ncbi:MAG: hypothetical protein QOF51_4002 [Chloroflexota bacterium]|jgi:predicted transcriptional regulator|nr:hypothetical protein [Chloroflexota bacterium]
MNKTTLYISDDLQRSLREVARRTGRRQADLIREALAAYVEQQVRPQLDSIGAGEDEELSGRASEEWLATHWSRG